jgi:hypothetical protein
MGRTVFTLTTSPQRMEHMATVLDSLRNQHQTPDAIYLNLPERYRDRAPYNLPKWLTDDTRVTLLRQEHDLGPIMKLLPVLEVEQEPDTLLVTVDDDVRYPPNLVSVFQAAAQKKPEAAFGSRGFNFTNNGQHLDPVRGHLVPCDVLQGYGACAYRRRHFDLERLNMSITAQPYDFRFSDDVLLSNHIASIGVPRFTIQLDSALKHMPWGDDDPQSLKFIGGGTHRRYEAMRKWFIKEKAWFAQSADSQSA